MEVHEAETPEVEEEETEPQESSPTKISLAINSIGLTPKEDNFIRRKYPNVMKIEVHNAEQHRARMVASENLIIPPIDNYKVAYLYLMDKARHLTLYFCTYPDCTRNCTRAHGFFDHLRSHCNDRPFHCDKEGCGATFR